MVSISVFTKIPNLLKELRRILPSLQFTEVFSDADDQLQKSEIIIGDFDLLSNVLYKLPNTKWIQGTWAGVDKIIPLINKEKPLPYIITRFSGEHFGKIMSEYVLYHIIGHERQFDRVRMNQTSKIWSEDGQISEYKIIADLSIGILGIGHIGNWLAQILHKFGASILGYGRRSQLSVSEQRYLSGYYTKSRLPEFLGNCDYIINVLPSTSETIGLLNGNVLENCRERKPVFINIGRGNIISDPELVIALNNEWISGAVLDVFNTEPLPKDSPLWSMPEVKITPHVSGMSRAKDIAEQFRDNLQLYRNQQPIPTTFDILKEY